MVHAIAKAYLEPGAGGGGKKGSGEATRVGGGSGSANGKKDGAKGTRAAGAARVSFNRVMYWRP